MGWGWRKNDGDGVGMGIESCPRPLLSEFQKTVISTGVESLYPC